MLKVVLPLTCYQGNTRHKWFLEKLYWRQESQKLSRLRVQKRSGNEHAFRLCSTKTYLSCSKLMGTRFVVHSTSTFAFFCVRRNYDETQDNIRHIQKNYTVCSAKYCRTFVVVQVVRFEFYFHVKFKIQYN